MRPLSKFQVPNGQVPTVGGFTMAVSLKGCQKLRELGPSISDYWVLLQHHASLTVLTSQKRVVPWHTWLAPFGLDMFSQLFIKHRE
eukprot:c44997_g1_i1 orf=54-311(+)